MAYLLLSLIGPIIYYTVIFLRDLPEAILFKNVLRYGFVGISDYKIQIFIIAQLKQLIIVRSSRLQKLIIVLMLPVMIRDIPMYIAAVIELYITAVLSGLAEVLSRIIARG